jgi:hypothetical protein
MLDEYAAARPRTAGPLVLRAGVAGVNTRPHAAASGGLDVECAAGTEVAETPGGSV